MLISLSHHFLCPHCSLSLTIELGAGCGLAGLFAATIGAKLVILTDLPEQIPHLEANLSLNRHLIPGEVICLPFTFGETFSDLLAALRVHSSPLIQELMNSNQDPTQLRIDCLIGADIGYDVSLLSPLSTSVYSVMYSSLSLCCRAYLVEAGMYSTSQSSQPLTPDTSAMERYLLLVP